MTGRIELPRRVEEDMRRVVSEVTRLVECRAVILMGGFGRGEGCLVTVDGREAALNDYDLMLVTEDPPGAAEKVRPLSPKLAEEFRTDFVDFDAIHPDRLSVAPLTIYYYDLKYGSRVVWGDTAVLDLLPDYRPEDIPFWEAVQLLFNRMAGLLSGFPADRRRGLNAREYVYMRNQLVKAGVACGDALVQLYDRYHHLYGERHGRFRRLADAGRLPFLPGDWVGMIDECYRQKLVPESSLDRDLWDWLEAMLPWFEVIFLHAMEAYAARRAASVPSAVRAYLGTCLPRHSFRGLARRAMRVARHGSWASFDTAAPPQRVYAALPLVLFSIPAYHVDVRRLRHAGRLLRGISQVRAPDDRHNPWSVWEPYREASFEAWSRFFH